MLRVILAAKSNKQLNIDSIVIMLAMLCMKYTTCYAVSWHYNSIVIMLAMLCMKCYAVSWHYNSIVIMLAMLCMKYTTCYAVSWHYNDNIIITFLFQMRKNIALTKLLIYYDTDERICFLSFAIPNGILIRLNYCFQSTPSTSRLALGYRARGAGNFLYKVRITKKALPKQVAYLSVKIMLLVLVI